jgi:simple sugar transport system ATP-binding protein
MDDCLLRLENIRKNFGQAQVLRGVSMQVGSNETIGLLGDNGAGKSTLIKCITGVHSPTSGSIWYKGEQITNHSVKRSRQMGIETVYQERALADMQSMWRNMFVGREICHKFGFLNVRKQKIETEKLLREHVGLTSKAITVDTEVKNLSGGEKQGIAISRALFFEADLIILDEPTVALSLSETSKVQQFVRTIKERGKSAIYISHNIYHVYDVCDRFVILDRGMVAGSFWRNAITLDDLMVNMEHLARTGALLSPGQEKEA